MDVENGQYKMEELSGHLDTCCRLIAEKYNKKNIEEWTNGDFLRLSSLLSNHTKVQISSNTLKRIFRKIKTPSWYYPQKATRDALAIYLGFRNWEDFTEQQPGAPGAPLPAPENAEVALRPVMPPPVSQTISWKPVLLAIAVTMALVVAAIAWWPLHPAHDGGGINRPPIKLVCTNPLGENPHSAIFTLVKPYGFDSLSTYKIDFGDGRTEDINAGDTLITHYYEVPGRFFATLLRNAVPVDTVAVYLRSNGWTATATIFHDTSRVYPINASLLFRDGHLSVNAPEAYRAGVDTNRTFFIEFVNTKPVNISGDNFLLSADLVTSPLRPGVRCSQVSINVFGERSVHRIYAMKPGCASWLALQLSEKTKAGKNNDLRSLGYDFSRGGNITLKVLNQHAEIFFDGKLVYNDSYQIPMNKIYGVSIKFSGTGSVNNFLLKDGNTGELFEEKFGKEKRAFSK